MVNRDNIEEFYDDMASENPGAIKRLMPLTEEDIEDMYLELILEEIFYEKR